MGRRGRALQPPPPPSPSRLGQRVPGQVVTATRALGRPRQTATWLDHHPGIILTHHGTRNGKPRRLGLGDRPAKFKGERSPSPEGVGLVPVLCRISGTLPWKPISPSFPRFATRPRQGKKIKDPRGMRKSLIENGCPGWGRTSDQVINSHSLDLSLSFVSLA